MPASRSASMPAAIASCVSRPSAWRRSASTPNSSCRSNAPARAASLMTSSRRSIVSNAGAAVVALDEPRDVLVEHLVAQAAGITSMPCSPSSRRARLRVVEQPLRAGQPERGAGDHDRLGRRRARLAALAHQLAAALDELGEQAPSSSAASARRAGAAARAAAAPPRRRRAACAVAPVRSVAASAAAAAAPTPEPGGPQAAQRLLNEATSPCLGWLVARLSTSSSPSTSAAKPCSARFGPDLDEHPRALRRRACAGP